MATKPRSSKQIRDSEWRAAYKYHMPFKSQMLLYVQDCRDFLKANQVDFDPGLPGLEVIALAKANDYKSFKIQDPPDALTLWTFIRDNPEMDLPVIANKLRTTQSLVKDEIQKRFGVKTHAAFLHLVETDPERLTRLVEKLQEERYLPQTELAAAE